MEWTKAEISDIIAILLVLHKHIAKELFFIRDKLFGGYVNSCILLKYFKEIYNKEDLQKMLKT